MSEVQLADKKKRKSKLTLLAMFGISALPIALASIMFYTGIGVPKETVNAGVLFKTPINVKALLSPSEPMLSKMQQRPKWRLLLPIGQSCNEQCEQNFYTSRQVHIRLGEKSTRVERIAINIGGTVGQKIFDEITTQHPKLNVMSVDAQQWQAWLDGSGLSLNYEDEPYYILVDQTGFAIMAYTTAQHGNQLLKDLKRALKYSIDYE